MARILITSGPTRQYLDPVRYLSNASSGRMGAALAAAAMEAGHEAIVVSGPVDVAYPAGAEMIPVVSTDDMARACLDVFPRCDGLIAAAAPCDYRPATVAPKKIRKVGGPLFLELAETIDVVATLAAQRHTQWIVAFALETEDRQQRALEKLRRKRCDLIVVNGPRAMQASDTQVEVICPTGEVVASFRGDKRHVGRDLILMIEERLICR